MRSSSPDIAAAYDAVTRSRREEEAEGGRRSAFRHFHNYVKKRLFQYALDHLRARGGVTAVQVLDLASGRGGDLGKWVYMESPALSAAAGGMQEASRHRVYTGRYACYDVSPECVAEARRRWSALSTKGRCTASFTVADCFSEDFLSTTLREGDGFGQFHVVSIQFALHYACRTVDSLRRLLETIADALVVGGLFLATTVDDAVLAARARDGALRHGLFELLWEAPPQWTSAAETDGDPRLVLGTAYHFRLDGFVDAPEYVVRMDVLRRLAAACGLAECPEASQSFLAYRPAYEAHWRCHKGHTLSPEEVSLTSLYRTICLVKT